MKKIILLVCLFYSISIYSQINLFNQYEPGTFYFRDGTIKKGLFKISGFSKNEIKFKKDKKDKKQILTHKEVKSIKYLTGDEYFYKIITNKKRIILIKREITGKIDLFSYVVRNSGPPAGGLGIPGGGVTIGFSFGTSSTVYLIGKKDSDFIVELPLNYKKKKFWQIISKYTSNCKEFADKIKNKNSIKKNFKNKRTAVIDMVNYYNQNCN